MGTGRRATRTGRAFSLVELLVVIGIIGILIALLAPVVTAVRKAANSTKCLAQLQQWSQGYQMYLNGNNGRSFVLGEIPGRLDKGNNPLMWFELLRPYHPEITESLLCPEATEAANMVPKNAFEAWGPERFWDTPTKVRGPYVGSYGFNSWLYQPAKDEDRMPDHLRLPTKEAARVPVIFDCARLDVPARDTDVPALFGAVLPSGTKPGELRWVALERHRGGVNVSFLDGHAEYVAPAGLWRLKWSEVFTPRDVTVQR